MNDAEAFVIESAERERKTSEVGELIMNRLRRYDKVAYVRFASVYLDFKDVQEFMTELKDLLVAPGGPRPGTTSGQTQGGNGGTTPGGGSGNGGTSPVHSGASSSSMSN